MLFPHKSLVLLASAALAGQASAALVLINEDFASLAGTEPTWTQSADPTPGVFELYTSSGANARGMATTYDHDNNAGTAAITIAGGIEVNDGASNMTLTATLTLPNTVDFSSPAVLTFWAGLRGSPAGAQTVEVLNVTESRTISGVLSPTLATGATPRPWTFNSFNINFTAADLGDIIAVRFSSTGSGAEGLQLTDLDFVAVPEPSVALLGGLGVLGLLRRRRA